MNVRIENAGPAVSVQDGGRAGGLGLGLSRGGAVDRLAWFEGVALLGQEPEAAAIEMAGFGGQFRFEEPAVFALTGAKMRASLDGAPVERLTTYLAGAGSVLKIGAAIKGVYGYLHLGGGVSTSKELGGRGYHRIAGLGKPVVAGDFLPVAAVSDAKSPSMQLAPMPAPEGPIRVMPGPQTNLFGDVVQKLFAETCFKRSPRANRQGVRLEHDGAVFSTEKQLNQVSDFISEGDIQMTGDGTPYVLLADCQTMGGYPRIGTVLPADLPRISQLELGGTLSFRFVTLAVAESAWNSDETILAGLKQRRELLVRDPREMGDLLSFELVDRPPDDITD